MAWIATAVLGGAVISTVANLVTSKQGSDAQSHAAGDANATQLSEFQQQQQNQQPWLDAGKKALGDLQTQMPDLTRKFSASDFQADPGYEFTLNQGLNAMQRSASAKGLLNSMGTMQNLNNYAQQSASNEYGNAYNRFTQSQNQRYNMLAGIAGTGQTANGQLMQSGMNAANNISNNQIGAGNSAAARDVATGNAIGGFAGNAANTYMNYNLMNRMFPQVPNPGGGGGGMNYALNGSSSLSMPEFGSSAGYTPTTYSLIDE